jgi:hypothetical protein
MNFSFLSRTSPCPKELLTALKNLHCPKEIQTALKNFAMP